MGLISFFLRGGHGIIEDMDKTQCAVKCAGRGILRISFENRKGSVEGQSRETQELGSDGKRRVEGYPKNPTA